MCRFRSLPKSAKGLGKAGKFDQGIERCSHSGRIDPACKPRAERLIEALAERNARAAMTALVDEVKTGL